MFISSNQITSLLNEYNTQLSQLDYPNNFQILSRDILYSPHLSIYNLDLNQSNYSSRNFENINFGKYLYDKISYQTIPSDKLALNSNINLLLTNNECPYVIPNIYYKSEIIWDPNNSCVNLDILLENIDLTNKDYILWKNIPTHPYTPTSIHTSIPTLIHTSIPTSTSTSIPDNYIEHFHLVTRNSIPKLTLEKLLILQRHGPREPLTIPSKFISTYWNTIHTDINKAINGANLTNYGKLYSKYIGKVLRDNYSNDLDFSNLSKSNILIGSSNFQRTIDTSILTLDGLELSNLNLDLEILNFLSSDAIFTPEQKKIYNDMMENNNLKFDLDLQNLIKKYLI